MAQPHKIDDWSCSKCTAINAPNVRRCSVCEARREADVVEDLPFSARKSTPNKRSKSGVVASSVTSTSSSNNQSITTETPQTVLIKTHGGSSEKPGCASMNNTHNFDLFADEDGDEEKEQPSNSTKANSSSCLPLKGVYVFIDVNFGSGLLPASEEMSKHLKSMGAIVRKSITSKTLTHLVFYKGDIERAIRARDDQGVLVIDQSWVEECRKSGSLVDEAGHLVVLESLDESVKTKRGRITEPMVNMKFVAASDQKFHSSQMEATPIPAKNQKPKLDVKNIDPYIGGENSLIEDDDFESAVDTCGTEGYVSAHDGYQESGTHIEEEGEEGGDEEGGDEEVGDGEVGESGGDASTVTPTSSHVFPKAYGGKRTNARLSLSSDKDDTSSTSVDKPKKQAKKSKTVPKKDTIPPSSKYTVGFSGFEQGEKATLASMAASVNVSTQSNQDKVTHLIVNDGGPIKRTIRLMFALLNQAHILKSDFIFNTLDGLWPREKDFYIQLLDNKTKKSWLPSKKRNKVLTDKKVFIDYQSFKDAPKIDVELFTALPDIIKLCGARVVLNESLCNVMIVSSSSNSEEVDDMFIDQANSDNVKGNVQRLTVSQLFDMIETAV